MQHKWLCFSENHESAETAKYPIKVGWCVLGKDELPKKGREQEKRKRHRLSDDADLCESELVAICG